MAEIKVATDANFQELVLGSDKPVVVDFWAVVVRAVSHGRAGDGEAGREVRRRDPGGQGRRRREPRPVAGVQHHEHPDDRLLPPGNDEAGKPYTPQGVVGFRPLEQLEAQFGLKQFLPAEKPAEQSATAA